MADAFPADFRAAGKRRRTQAPSDLYSAKFHAAERLRRAADNAETLRLPPVGHDAHIVPDPTSTAAPTDTRSVTQPPYDASAPTASDPLHPFLRLLRPVLRRLHPQQRQAPRARQRRAGRAEPAPQRAQ